MVSSNCKLGINRVSLQRVSEVIKIAVILITDLPCVKSHSAGSGSRTFSLPFPLYSQELPAANYSTLPNYG